MPRILFYALLTCLCLPALAPAQDARPNLLSNPGFEKWNQPQGLPPGWIMVMGQSASVFSRESENQRSGLAAMRVQLTAENNTGWLTQQVGGIHPDTEYRLSGWTRVAADTKIPLNLVVEPNLGGTAIPATAEWSRWEWIFNTREAIGLQPQFRLRGQGTVWLDDLKLEQVSETGASVMPDRAELLKLLEYQAQPVDPATNTDDWTAPFRAAQPAAAAFPNASDKSVTPVWRVGEWARYLCEADLIVPSSKPEKRPHLMLIDCAVVGAEKVGERQYYWLQSVVRLQRQWVAQARGPYDSGEKILLDRPRKVVLTILVEGPECRDVRRYQLQVDDEPPLEYVAGEGAALPWLDTAFAWVRPLCEAEKPSDALYHLQVPVTGLVSGSSSAPHCSRRLQLINRGEAGARDERAAAQPTLIRLPLPPYIGIAFDGFGTPAQAAEMVAAGAGLLENLPGLYLGDNRALYNHLPAYFSEARCWDVDLFDLCRANFAGFAPHLDEPYQRQRKPNEYLKRGEVATLPEAADRYTEALSKLVSRAQFWPGHSLHSYDSPTSAAWYDLRAGAGGFVLENARLSDELTTIARVTGRQDARELADEINIAFLAGATRRFGGWWGQGIYHWVPERYWHDELVYYASRGARFVGFWLEKKPAPQPELAFYDQVLAELPRLKQALAALPPPNRQPQAVIVVPYGVVVGLSGSPAEKPWGILDYPEGTALTERLITEAARLHDAGVTFDVVIEDPKYPPQLQDYAEIIRMP